MKFTQTLLLSAYATVAFAAEEEALPLRRLRQQTLHIPDLFEMAETKKAEEWYEPARLMKNRNTAQKLYEMDVFERLLQSDGSLSFSMPPTAPTPVVPTPIVTPPVPVKAPIMTPPVKAPIMTPPVKAPTGIAPSPVMVPPTVVVVPTPVAVPVDTSCPYYPACAAMGLVGDCCPTPDGVFLDCCTATPPVMAPTIVVTPVAPIPVISPPIAPTAVAPVPDSPVAAPKSKTGSMSSGSMSSTPTSPGVGSPVAAPKSKDSGMRRHRA